MKADVQLLFGVLGGGELSGASGRKIHGQLTNIANQINRNPFKIRFQAEEKSLEKMRGNIFKIFNELSSVSALKFNTGGAVQTSNVFANITQNVGNTVSGLHQMNVELTRANAETLRAGVNGVGGLSENSINSIVNSLSSANVILTNVRANIDNLGTKQGHIVSLTLQGENAAGQTSTRLVKIVQETGEVLKDTTDISAKLAEINSQTGQTEKKTSGMSEGYKNASRAVKEYYAELTRVIGHSNIKQGSSGFYSVDGKNDLDQVNKLNRLQVAYNNAMTASANFSETERNNFYSLYSAQLEQYTSAINGVVSAKEKKKYTDVEEARVLNNLSKAIGDSTAALRNNSAAEKSRHESSRNAFTTLKDETSAAVKARIEWHNGKKTVEELIAQTDKLNSVKKSSVGIWKQNGDAAKSWGDKLKGLTKRLSTYFGAYRIIMALYRLAQNMVKTVVEIDTAMTELKKVTDETDVTYRKFLDNATVRAKKLGATISDVVTASADFARLGFTIEESESLADAVIVYKNVGDGIDDINTASESIIATMQAFGVETKDVMSIVDKFNEVGNNYAISSKGVGDALLRSAAAMHSANNTLDQTIALAAAANTVVKIVPRCYGNIAA